AVISAEPSILTYKLKPQHMFVIFVSDGLWEQLSDEAVVEIVHKNPRNVSFISSLRIQRITSRCGDMGRVE
ncbi:hypothetical protein R6Q59_028378, partial [Mikania micrantha]